MQLADTNMKLIRTEAELREASRNIESLNQNLKEKYKELESTRERN